MSGVDKHFHFRKKSSDAAMRNLMMRLRRKTKGVIAHSDSTLMDSCP